MRSQLTVQKVKRGADKGSIVFFSRQLTRVRCVGCLTLGWPKRELRPARGVRRGGRPTDPFRRVQMLRTNARSPGHLMVWDGTKTTERSRCSGVDEGVSNFVL